MTSLTESYWQDRRQRQNQLLSMFRSTLTTLSKLKLTNIDHRNYQGQYHSDNHIRQEQR